jgi:hypothetical protein
VIAQISTTEVKSSPFNVATKYFALKLNLEKIELL